MAPLPPGQPSSSSRTARMTAPTTADLRKWAHARLAERTDPARTRYKPLSILRAEAKRLFDQFFDTECPVLSKADRERLAEDTLAESLVVGPMEELFRDDGVTEIQILAAGQVIARKQGAWLPTNARFRDQAQIRSVLARYEEIGEPYSPSDAVGGFDVRLPNGFRVMAVIPPDVLDQPPLVLLIRASGAVLTPPPPSAIPVITTPPPSSYAGPGSSVLPGMSVRPPGSAAKSGDSTLLPGMGSAVLRTSSASGGSRTDPVARVRDKATARIIDQLATLGVSDFSRIPVADLKKIVAAYVIEICVEERFGLDEAGRERVVLEILSGMLRKSE